MRAFILALCMIATPAMAADRFDLVCKGQQRTSIAGKWKPYEVHYRVDTAAKIFCRFECKSTETLASVDAARIEFQKSSEDRSRGTVIHYVDRTNGAWKYYLSSSVGLLGDAEGKCEALPFTGFPAPKI